MASGKKKIPLREEEGNFEGLLAQRLQEKGFQRPPEVKVPRPGGSAAVAGPPDVALERASKIVLRRETAGRGGKTVTIVSLHDAAPFDLEALAKTMRKALGCGAHIEDDHVVLHGDIADRAQKWLEQKGIQRIVRGN